MKIELCLYENDKAEMFDPISLTRPVFSLLCGTKSIIRKISQTLGLVPAACFIRKYLQESVSVSHKNLVVNSGNWVKGKDGILFVDTSWIPAKGFKIESENSHLGICSGKPVYYFCKRDILQSLSYVNDNKDLLEGLRGFQLPEKNVEGDVLNYLWDLVENNGNQIIHDMIDFHPQWNHFENTFGLVGPPAYLFIHPGARIAPFVAIDSTKGPVVIEDGVKIESFTKLEGPCFIGRDTQVFGAKIRSGTSIGPNCRIGGEIEKSIILGHSNKYHEGFLGHSYLGEWVNLGAATNASDLRNDYGLVKVQIDGQLINTGLKKVGVFLGDHARTSIGVLLNTGSNIGAFANLLPGGLLPRNVPAFASSKNGMVVQGNPVELLIQIASVVMERRQCELTEDLRCLYEFLFHFTSAQRKKIPFDSEIPLKRKSA